MLRFLKHPAVYIAVLMLSVSCAIQPLTGRRQFTLIPQSNMLAMSTEQYGQFLDEAKVVTDDEEAQMVQRVGSRLQYAAEEYLRYKNMEDQIESFEWEFNLIDDDTMNAWAMPGGKIVIYRGLLPVAENDDGLAVVMGHEIAHALAQHGNERMSQGLLVQLGGMALSTAVREKPEETQQLWMAAFGLGAQFGILFPYSRMHENEADSIGLMLMAMAGYDPNEAINFWQRMMDKKDQPSPPEFLSTHPADQTRIDNIRRTIPSVMPYHGMAILPDES